MMKSFSYSRASSIQAAREATHQPDTALLAGGTSLLDLAKSGVAEPDNVLDISHLAGLGTITVNETGAVIGTLARMSTVANHPVIKARFPAVAQSLSLAASAQLRNMATVGGNLMQRTRCSYFRDPGTFAACNKRAPGSGCSAIGGVTRNHAVLGTSDLCIASYPGDLAVALTAFDATVDVGERQIAIDDFFLPYGDAPHLETLLKPGEMILSITIPASAAAENSTYLKIRDRQSYEFAAASAAVGLELEEDGRTIRDIRIALGGVASKPWRVRAVEQALIGKLLEPQTVEQASRLSMEGAVSQGDNHYKIQLAPRVIARAVLTLGGLA